MILLCLEIVRNINLKAMKEKKNHNLTEAIIINAVILAAVLLLTDMAYETNDDFAIASRLASGYPYVGFVNYFLCKAVIAVQQLIPGVNWYVIMLIAASFAGFTCILYTIFEAGKDKIIRIASVAMVAFFSFDHYCTIQFTKTAALVMTAGMLMLVDCLTEKKRLTAYIIPMMLVYLGACIRVDALLGAAGFAGIYGLVWLVQNRKSLLPDGYFTIPRIVLYLCVVALVAGAYGLDQYSCRINVSTDALRYAEDYSVYRSNIVDFPTYEYYEENAEAYDAIGISENDLYLIDHWVFDYEGAASMENLRNIDSIERNNDSRMTVLVKSVKRCVKDIYRGVRKLSFTGIHIIYLCCLAVWLILATKPRHWLYVLGVGIMAIALYCALYYMQRPTYRALYVADIGASVWLLYYLMKISDRETSGRRKGSSAVMGIAVILITAMLMVPAYRGCQTKADAAAGKAMSEAMQDYFLDHEDNFYVWATTEKKSSRLYASPWIAPDARDRNVTGTGTWGVLSPYMLDRLAEYGIYNPIKDLIDNDNAYYIGNKNITRLEEYFNKWYGTDGIRIVMEQTDEVDGRKVWRVISQSI